MKISPYISKELHRDLVSSINSSVCILWKGERKKVCAHSYVQSRHVDETIRRSCMNILKKMCVNKAIKIKGIISLTSNSLISHLSRAHQNIVKENVRSSCSTNNSSINRRHKILHFLLIIIFLFHFFVWLKTCTSAHRTRHTSATLNFLRIWLTLYNEKNLLHTLLMAYNCARVSNINIGKIGWWMKRDVLFQANLMEWKINI